jgi:glycosyltransferase involved in cell wall biosynthesis
MFIKLEYSIIILTFNEELCLEKTLLSLAEIADCDLIIAVGGCSDKIIEKLKEWLENGKNKNLRLEMAKIYN